jgi:hypothetical protein
MFPLAHSCFHLDAFDACILVEATKPDNAKVLDADVEAALNSIRPGLHTVYKEEDVTNNNHDFASSPEQPLDV